MVKHAKRISEYYITQAKSIIRLDKIYYEQGEGGYILFFLVWIYSFIQKHLNMQFIQTSLRCVHSHVFKVL